MGKRKDVEKAAPSADTAAEPKIEPMLNLRLDGAVVAVAISEMPAVEAAPPLMPGIEAVKLTDIPVIEDIPVAPLAAGDDDGVAAEAPPPPVREHKFMLLAASVALAAAFGAMAGALGAYGIVGAPTPAVSATASGADNFAMQDSIVKMRGELAALKSSIDAVNNSSKTQITKITERFDRLDRAQAEPAGKLTKAMETLERIEKRSEPPAASKDVTGSVPQATPVSAPQPPQPPVVPGWVLRDVSRGIALIQGARYGLIEVGAGDQVPGLGRIESIKKQDGRWVVVTSRGLVTMR